ncbi:LOW QUALITY PROTEIN: Hypothetical protein PHPALM_19667 [Phytophthora palmivora]|uniref:Uncharacterized protein n=1 Tax=Phytophthora palmivora TaxID=4796 RepID=A0A2P4XGT5_9STRA|nr:LOW QUALITY PROTEIN: Hypothetical protein PHPALM_19667 [Phytophthora palmivora]
MPSWLVGHICSTAHAWDRCNLDSNEAPSVPLSAGCVCGYRSALVDVYHSKLLKLDQHLDTELRRVLEGYEKPIKNLKKRGVMKITRIQSCCNMSNGLMAVLTLKGKDTKLIKQVQKNLASMFTLFRMNPHSDRYLLLICIYFPVLTALWLFIGGDKKSDSGGFYAALLKVCVLSCNPKEIGTHSLRKGGSSHAAGQVNGVCRWAKVLITKMTGAFISVKEQISFANDYTTTFYFGKIWGTTTALSSSNNWKNYVWLLGSE